MSSLNKEHKNRPKKKGGMLPKKKGGAFIISPMDTVHCATCCLEFSSPLIPRRRVDGDDFYCPLGHSNVFMDAAAQREQREEAERKREHEAQLAEVRRKAELREAYKPQVDAIFDRLLDEPKTSSRRWISFRRRSEDATPDEVSWSTGSSANPRIRRALRAREEHLMAWFDSKLKPLGMKLADGEYDYQVIPLDQEGKENE